MSWMKNYIAEHLKWLLFFVIMILLMFGMLILNGVPTEEVVYAIGLCVAVFAVILILDGIIFLIIAITILEQTKTAVVERPIPNPFIADVVTANVGHIPIT